MKLIPDTWETKMRLELVIQQLMLCVVPRRPVTERCSRGNARGTCSHRHTLQATCWRHTYTVVRWYAYTHRRQVICLYTPSSGDMLIHTVVRWYAYTHRRQVKHLTTSLSGLMVLRCKIKDSMFSLNDKPT